MQIYENFPLADITTFKVGGPARYLTQPTSKEELQEALLWAKKTDLPFFIIGGGSNLLISDTGYNGLIIHLKKLDKLSIVEKQVHCEAGVSVAKLTTAAAQAGLSGLEFAGGLPGSVGGAVYMNARAYGGSFADIVTSATVVNQNGKIQQLSAQEMQYDYKHSRLMNSGEILISVELTLTPNDSQTVLQATEENRSKRVQGGQFLYPNAGCIFKNNYQVGIPSGKLIDDTGLLGLSIGGATVYEKHGNFIINRDGAKAKDIKELISKIKEIVQQKQGVLLEEEVRYLGFDD